jgi:hypothetical protein
LGRGEEVAAIAGPAGYGVSIGLHQCRSAFVESGEIVPQRLDLSRVALQFARNAIGFNVEDYHCAVHLENVLAFGPVS